MVAVASVQQETEQDMRWAFECKMLHMLAGQASCLLQVGSLPALQNLYLAGCGCCRPQAAVSLLHMGASVSTQQAWAPAVPLPHRACKTGVKWLSHCLQAWASPGPVRRRRARTGVNRTGVTMQKKRQREMREAEERTEAAKAQRSQQAQQVRPG